jgi:hypothetical protein
MAKTSTRATRGTALLAVLWLVVLTFQAAAAPRSPAEVQAAVQTWLRHVVAAARPDASVDRLEPAYRDVRLVAYVAHLSGGGFCLCGSDDRLLPVYVYNPGDAYDPAFPGYQYVLLQMGHWLASLEQPSNAPSAAAAVSGSDFAARAAYWDCLVAGQAPAAPVQAVPAFTGGEPGMMTLNVTSHWHQDPPYNSLCPYLTDTEQTIVGCVATAMAQILYYWKWPPTGESNQTMPYWYRWQTTWIEEPLATNPNIPANWGGGGRLEWTSANGGRLRMNGFWDESVYGAAVRHSQDATYRTALQTLYDRPASSGGMNQESVDQYADFGTTTYRWDLMHDSPATPPDAGDQLAALASYHAGISVYMHWGIWLSSSWDPHPRNAYVDHWRYASGVLYESRSIDRMTEEIQWLRPVQLGGADPNLGGHAWVVMGYDKSTDPNRLFLMNVGWQGRQYEWHTCDTFFPDDQTHYTRIAPRDVVKFVGNTVSGDGSPGSPYRNLAEAVTNAPSGATLIFKAGTINSAPTPLLIDKPLTIKGFDVLIQ